MQDLSSLKEKWESLSPVWFFVIQESTQEFSEPEHWNG